MAALPVSILVEPESHLPPVGLQSRSQGFPRTGLSCQRVIVAAARATCNMQTPVVMVTRLHRSRSSHDPASQRSCCHLTHRTDGAPSLLTEAFEFYTCLHSFRSEQRECRVLSPPMLPRQQPHPLYERLLHGTRHVMPNFLSSHTSLLLREGHVHSSWGDPRPQTLRCGQRRFACPSNFASISAAVESGVRSQVQGRSRDMVILFHDTHSRTADNINSYLDLIEDRITGEGNFPVVSKELQSRV